MYHAKTLNEKIRLFVMILWPILITQISLNAMNVIDTMMSGRAGTDDLAGVAIGSSLWMPILTGINGILLAVTPIVAQLIGKGMSGKVAESVTQALYLSVLLAITVFVAGAFFLDPILTAMSLDPEVQYVAKHYLIGISIGLIPLFAANVLRYFFDAQGYTRITMIIMLFAVPFNFVLNYLLIFGSFGFPKLGGIGAGYATALTYWLVFFISVFMTFKMGEMRKHRLFLQWYKPDLTAWKEQLAIGVPMGLSIFFEASIFSGVTLLMGTMFNTVTIAAHQAAISFTSLLFMLPLSISMALTILVAFEVGAGRFHDAKQYSKIGVLGSIGILGCCSVGLFFFREQIAYLYTDNPQVVELTMAFFLFAILYQLSDAAQASLQGVLRGYKDVKVPFIVALVSYWAIGIPSGYALATLTALGPYGFWLGITIGLTCASIGFYIRLASIERKQLTPAY
ncbi:MATE family efflux transporter [Bacillus gobiensis]|uniref:MATE family efflux transporter n=1 Tax=Bacillus gobiensis TaxID=1441095 RepID=UPI003D1D2AC8